MTNTGGILSGKRVLITGGGTGAGADLARGFAEQGAEVVISGRRSEPLEAVASSLSNTRALTADVTQEDDVIGLFQAAGAVDIVIANAGAAASAPLTRTSLEDWNAMLAVNLTGVFLTLRQGLLQMPAWGRLICIASTAGLKGYPYVAPYVAAKHGAVGLVRALAQEVARKAITVNALCPGFLDTEMTRRSIDNIVDKTGMSADEARKTLAAHNPQGRLIQPSEVTAAALWLCGPGSEGINGQALPIAGGEL
jgi:NAD(P)-dependent dehydrogenase (short-subunit alcohol dehydrogenase family)